MEEQVICPWCLTEIVWDEEIGPELRCPHCDNELSSYRTIELGYDEDEVEEDEYERARQLKSYSDSRKAAAPYSEDEMEDEDASDDDEEEKQPHWNDSGDGTRSLDVSQFAVEENIQRVLDDQDEVPECPVCREYMLEAGTHTMQEPHFVNRTAPSLGEALLDMPFTLNLYVCPSCYHTASLLSAKDRDVMRAKLSPKE